MIEKEMSSNHLAQKLESMTQQIEEYKVCLRINFVGYNIN